MKKILMFALVLAAATSQAQEKTVMVGGAAMYPSKNIVQNAINSKDHTTLVAAVKAAGLVDALQGEGPFTVFAPTNQAFTLLKAENKAQLQGVLTYHVVSGNWDAQSLKDMIKKNNGKATITTLSKDTLYASLDEDGNVWLWDENGGKAKVTIANVYQKNGVIHVIDGVLVPKM
jgi:uncharacterized surface protein with fasciclin (FAS1) repeats